ncbi:nucleotidyltransferase AbiEii toxin of type IV toxin-antitoxin system [Kribbella pratensis]|uniref:Nucleotidyltransferase AbiEii toxin of type IV toxin-antitoxin system n=1 Tax=Kribbella pratensis TaxID=2512112 RepID=A0ABY2F9R6_9ACTN|nr:nucleotidyl transferase AbiEii/AbiGii toxin family protein [Kribbella pratensis]TDW87332.1 nucleotidyltransferase AbiEii toxin of type IV toxin-antitoxin system [Kribbella pratensis]
MTEGEAVFRQIQNKARSDGAKEGRPTPTAEYLTRHALDSFLDRLTRTEHKDGFVLKGGFLLATYGVRRPTKDVDAEVVGGDLTAERIAQVVRDIAAVDVADGLRFDLGTISFQEIRDEAEYPGLRMRVDSYIGPQKVVVAWDISAGDPIVPPPRSVKVRRLLGGEIEILGYAPETTIAEKGVTILERGITSTRWRDYVDIVQLARQHDIDERQLLEAVSAVASYRKVELGPVAPVVAGYGAVAQAKWAAWRRKERVEAISEPDLDDQMAKVVAVLDPVFVHEATDARPLGPA